MLYVYGYGGSHLSSSVEKLRRELPEDKFKVMCWDYPQRDCRAAIRFLEHKIISKLDIGYVRFRISYVRFRVNYVLNFSSTMLFAPNS